MSRKLTELTQVADASGNTLFYLVDLDRALTDQAVSIDIDDLKNLLGVDQTEEQINGTRLTNATVTGSTNIDWDLYSVFEFTLTGATTLVDVNLPRGANVKTINMVIGGNQTLSFPAYWEALPNNDDYSTTVRNLLTITVINGTASSEDVVYSLTNLAI